MHPDFKCVNNLTESKPLITAHMFYCLIKMSLQRYTVFFPAEFEYDALTLKEKRLCSGQLFYCQDFYLTVRFYLFAIAVGSWKPGKDPKSVKSRAFICFLTFFLLYVAPHCFWGIKEHADSHPPKKAFSCASLNTNKLFLFRSAKTFPC